MLESLSGDGRKPKMELKNFLFNCSWQLYNNLGKSEIQSAQSRTFSWRIIPVKKQWRNQTSSQPYSDLEPSGNDTNLTCLYFDTWTCLKFFFLSMSPPSRKQICKGFQVITHRHIYQVNHIRTCLWQLHDNLVFGLHDSEDRVILWLLVSAQCTCSVWRTDGQTDRRRDIC